MIRILAGENGGYYFNDEETEPFLLHQNNTILNLHRDEDYKDRFAICEGEDGWHQWWRCDEDPETFEKMENVAITVGSVLVRSTATVALNVLFDVSHKFTDEDGDQLLDGVA